ncbi:MAG: tetratricopeptide repeat protein [Oligoflexales bacterium]
MTKFFISIFMIEMLIGNICTATTVKNQASKNKKANIKEFRTKRQVHQGVLEYQIGVEKFNKRSFKEAAGYFSSAAKKGLADAQYSLGFMFEYGQGVKKNYETAAHLLALATKQGHMKAQYSLGFKYQHGQGVEQNSVKAVRLLTPVAKRGYAKAQHALGTMYENGVGVEQDYETAVHLFVLAIKQGFARAYYALGLMYENGKSVEQDTEMAIKLFTHAASRGYARAQDKMETYGRKHSTPSYLEEKSLQENLKDLECTFSELDL